jgi:Tfp pilus assembly protein PilV
MMMDHHHHHQQSKPSIPNLDHRGEKGVSLVEAIIGLLVLTIVLLSGAQLFRVHVEHLALVDRARRADVQANATMNTLAAYDLSALADGNPFSGKGNTDPIASGERITLSSNICLAQANCDQIVKLPQSTGTGSDYTTIGWNQPLPTNSTVVYYRAWRVTTIDASKGLRRITLAILPAEPNTPTAAIEPLALRQTDVVQRQ